MSPQQYGPADVQYNDWRGTVACDDPHEGIEEITEFARLPRGWTIVAIELGGGSEVDRDWGWVLAVENRRIREVGDLAALADASGGAIPVKRFRVLESDGVGVLRAMKRWSIHMHRTEHQLDVEEDADEQAL